MTIDRLRRRSRSRHDPEGRMALVEHLRELRSRLVRAALAVLVGSVLGWIYYDPLFTALTRPFRDQLPRVGGVAPELVFSGIAAPFTFQVKIALLAGFVLAAPVWTYQLWAFVAPGMHQRERRYGYAFAAAGTPLFLAGMALAYWLLPKSFSILFGFTPPVDVRNLVQVDDYLSFTLRFLLVFGVAFLLPVLLVLLNGVGVLPARALRRAWRPVVFAIFVFAAAATPTPDPFTMLIMATPMLALFGIALAITTLVDHRRAVALASRAEPDLTRLDDDEPSPLDERPSRLD